jgi:hypothetical protein
MDRLETSVTSEAAVEHIEAHVSHLRDRSHARAMLLTAEWPKQFPASPGVYAVFDEKNLIYVGESGSLRERMGDLRETRHHTLRRQLGAVMFGDQTDFRHGSSKARFPDSIEAVLNEYIRGHLTVNVVVVNLGRKEIEELLINREKPKFNLKTKRGSFHDPKSF